MGCGDKHEPAGPEDSEPLCTVNARVRPWSVYPRFPGLVVFIAT
jgi:hypothetical protein